MMTKSHVITSVLQAVTLSALASLISHYLMNNVYEFANNSQLFSNYTAAIGVQTKDSAGASSNSVFALNGTSLALNATHNATITVHDNGNTTTSSSFSSPFSDEKPFYTYTFPRSMLVELILTIMNFYWQIWLERMFPGRKRMSQFPAASSEKSPLAGEGEDDESREDAIIQKWIAQGKVKRASLDWWNTFMKWILDMSLGTLWIQVSMYLFKDVLLPWNFNDFSKDRRWWVKWEILIRCAVSFVDLRPLTSLIAFVIIPAHKRIVFLAGADLIWSTCFGLIAGAVVPMLERNEFFSDMMKNMTAQANEAQKVKIVAVTVNNETRLVDEL